VTEEYLHLAAQVTGESEPWVPYMEAAQKLYEDAPRDRFAARKDLEVAYAYISAARRHLRQVAFFYIREVHGGRRAHRAFPEVSVGDRDDQIINLIFAPPPRT
jgi:hypothetical protein